MFLIPGVLTLILCVKFLLISAVNIKVNERVLTPTTFDAIDVNLITTLNLSDNDFEYIQEGTFDIFPNLRRLLLVNNNLSLENLFSFGNISNVEMMWLGNVRESEPVSVNSTLRITNFFPNLKMLYLLNVGARNILNENWSKVFPQLSILMIAYNENINLENFFENFPRSIEDLKIAESHLTNIKVAELNNLQYLDLRDNDFRSLILTDVPEICESEFQACIGPMNNLKYLGFRNSNISVFNVHFIYKAALHNLERLALMDNKLKAIEIHPFMGQHFPKLRELGLDNSSFDDLQSSLQKIACRFTNLKGLYLREMRGNFNKYLNEYFSDECAANLKRLYLNNNNLREIPRNVLGNLQNLEVLDLSNNMLTKFSFMPVNSLRVLSLRNNKFRCNTDCVDAIKLNDLKQLECLDLRKNVVGPDGLNYLKPVLNVTRKKMYPCFYIKNEYE